MTQFFANSLQIHGNHQVNSMSSHKNRQQLEYNFLPLKDHTRNTIQLQKGLIKVHTLHVTQSAQRQCFTNTTKGANSGSSAWYRQYFLKSELFSKFVTIYEGMKLLKYRCLCRKMPQTLVKQWLETRTVFPHHQPRNIHMYLFLL